MPEVALHTVLKAGCEDAYDAVHRQVPPDLVDALRSHGVSEWRIWRDGRHVFHLVTVDDYQAMRAGLRDLPVNVAWQDRVGPLFDVPDSYAGDDDGLPLLWSLGEQVVGAAGG